MKQDNAEGSSSSDIDLSARQQEVLVGTLLGDGCLAKHGRHHRLHIKHKVAHRSLAEFKREVFRDFVSMPLHEFDQKLRGMRYPCVQFASRTHPVFSKWYTHFYRDRRKIVPCDIHLFLSPLAIAVWFMDDGAADHCGATFQTHGFSVTEVELLVKTLQERFGLAVNSRGNRGRRIIYVQSAGMARLNEIVTPYLLPEFAYKLERRVRTP